jgi:hypothetical protein
VPVDIPEHRSVLADTGATVRVLGGPAAGARLGLPRGNSHLPQVESVYAIDDIGPPADLVGKIESDIRKSGFPLEMFVLNVCSTKNTGRMPSVRYEHLDQLREIDLDAFFETIAASHHTCTDLIIECKKSSEKPWVFFSTAAYSFDNVACFLKYTSEFDLYFRKHESPSWRRYIRDFRSGITVIQRCLDV